MNKHDLLFVPTNNIAARISPKKRYNKQIIAFHVHDKSLYIFLPSSARQEREMTKFGVV